MTPASKTARPTALGLLTGYTLAVLFLKLVAAVLRICVATVWVVLLLLYALIRWDARQLPKRMKRQVLPFLFSQS